MSIITIIMNERIRKCISFLMIICFFVLATGVIVSGYYISDINASVKKVTNKHFLMMQDEGYLSKSIEKSIINDISDTIGNPKNLTISGTNKKANEGESIFLTIEIDGFLAFRTKRVGIRKYILN